MHITRQTKGITIVILSLGNIYCILALVHSISYHFIFLFRYCKFKFGLGFGQLFVLMSVRASLSSLTLSLNTLVQFVCPMCVAVISGRYMKMKKHPLWLPLRMLLVHRN